MRVCLDAGHGGKDVGAWGKGGLLEKDIALSASLMEKACFEKYGHEVILTRETDEDVPLEKRIDIANKSDAHILISNHVNTGGARGVEVYHSASDVTGKKSAQNICRFLSYAGLINRGAKIKKGIGGDYNMIIRESHMTAVKIELGFIDNTYDSVFLKDNFFLNKFAEAIVFSILDTFEPEFNYTEGESHDVFLDEVLMLTVNDFEMGKRYIVNAVQSKICNEGSLILKNSGEKLFYYKL